MEKPTRLQPGLVAAILVGLIALLFYGLFISLNFASVAGGGEANLSNAFATLGAFAALWLSLLVLLVIDLVRTRRPLWIACAAPFLILVAGIAVLFATDYPHDGLCTLSVVALPLVIGTYLMIGIPPRLRAMAEGHAVNAIMLLLMIGLSIYPIERFAS